MIDLQKRRWEIITLATNVFGEIIATDSKVRQDEKERTGIKVLVCEANTRNLLLFSVGKPSEAAEVFVVEKAVRSAVDHDCSSSNTANPDKMQFGGCVGSEFNGQFLQASVSGLKESEDTAIAIIILAKLIGESPWNLYKKLHETPGMPYLASPSNDYLRIILRNND